MKRIYVILKIFVLVLSAIVSIGVAESTESNSSESLLRKAERFLEAEEFDSATTYSMLAYRRGMAEDSLFFFWSEIFLRKGAGDTALAFNLKLDPENSPISDYRILDRRRQIYELLGWNDKVDKTLEMLLHTREHKLRLTIPSLGVLLDGGIRRGKSQPALDYYNRPPSSDTLEPENGWFSTDKFWLRWRVPVGGPTLEWQIGAGVRKPYYYEELRNAPDSSVVFKAPLDISLNRMLGFASLGVGAEAELSRRASPSVIASAHIAFSGTGVSWNNESRATYTTNVINGTYASYHSVDLYAKISRTATKRPGLSFTLAAQGYFSEEWAFEQHFFAPNAAATVHYADDIHANFVQYYRDDSYSKESRLDTTGKTGWQYSTDLNKLSEKSSLSSLIGSSKVRLPNSYFSFSPECKYMFQKGTVLIGPAISYRFLWYFDQYEWTEIPSEGDAEEVLLVYDRKTGEYYRRKGMFGCPSCAPLDEGNPRDVRAELDNRPFAKHHSKKRLDHTISAGTDVYWIQDQIGLLSLNVQGGRTFSTIEHLPFQNIDVWWWSAGLTWVKTFGRKN